MNKLILAVCLLAMPGVARAQNSCTAPGAFLSTAAGVQAQRTKNHDWMTKSRATVTTAWDAARLDTFLLPGSHDAGTYGPTTHKPTGTSDRWGQTQSYSILDQLCQGSRWFDIRFKKEGANFHIWHNTHLFAPSGDILAQFSRFVSDPAHAGEVIFIRFKFESKTTDLDRRALLQAWSNTLRPWLVPNPNNGTLFGLLTMQQVYGAPVNARAGARVFLLDYEPAIAATDTLRTSFWAYPANQAGTFSDKVLLMMMRSGQKSNVEAWKANKQNKMFGLWWTSTGTVGAFDVRANTEPFWPRREAKKKAPLEEFFTAQGCEVGNFLVTDFYGDRALYRAQTNVVLSIVEQYNIARLMKQKNSFCP